MFAKFTVRRLFLAAVFLLVTNILLAQKTITGTITDENTSQPVAGSTISVKGSKVATQTNSEGNFTISVPDGATRLTVSSVGFETRDILISGRDNISLSLKTSTSSLNEVVVVGYGSKT